MTAEKNGPRSLFLMTIAGVRRLHYTPEDGCMLRSAALGEEY
ncbi:MAG: hypothetical protein ACETWM_15600 [Candidatus Lokiarchaeia archaeon]